MTDLNFIWHQSSFLVLLIKNMPPWVSSCLALPSHIALQGHPQAFPALLPALLSGLRGVCAHSGSSNQGRVLLVMRGALVFTHNLVHKVFAHLCSNDPFRALSKAPPTWLLILDSSLFPTRTWAPARLIWPSLFHASSIPANPHLQQSLPIYGFLCLQPLWLATVP